VNDTLTPREYVEEMWIMFFKIVKSVLVFLVTIINMVGITIYLFADGLFKGTNFLYKTITTWEPVKPQIFDIERNDNEERILG
jgi:hypothetical protein